MALASADSDALLVERRTTGVLHVYTGPLTASGRSVPHGRRALCRVHARRLTVAPRTVHGRSLCARCSACLSKSGRQAEQCITVTAVRARYSHLTAADLVEAAQQARTSRELEHVGHVALVVLTLPGCLKTTVTATSGDDTHTVADHIGAHRRRLDPSGSISRVDRDRAQTAAAAAARRSRAKSLREARISRNGMHAYKP